MYAPALLLALGAAAASGAPRQHSPTALLDTAIARIGGPTALSGLRSIRYEMLTQWQRISFDTSSYTDRPSYERHVELRDYTTGAWRNTRQFPVGATWREITDVVVDSVGARRSGASGPWAPLPSAYLDERREVFTFAAERLLPLARAAADLRRLPDSSIAGVRHARVRATVSGIPVVLHLRARDGMLGMVSYRASQPKDFGLAPWGVMDVEWWYSGWQPLASGVTIPTQVDVRRVGRPYKRMTVLFASANAAAPADSFVVGDSLRAAFLATAWKPMYDLPLDSAKLVLPRLASFGTPGAPVGAVKLGNDWYLLESGAAPLSIARAAGWLRQRDAGSRVSGVILSSTAMQQGGLPWAVHEKRALFVAPSVMPVASAVAAGAGIGAPSPGSVVAGGRWIRSGGDSARVEPIDLPDFPGALVVYVPSLSWAYCAPAASPLQQRSVQAFVRARGWNVSRMGNARSLNALVN